MVLYLLLLLHPSLLHQSFLFARSRHSKGNYPRTLRVLSAHNSTSALPLINDCGAESSSFFVPSLLAYGEEGRGEMIPPGSNLRFDIELLSIDGVYK